jgi:hypothetical protein
MRLEVLDLFADKEIPMSATGNDHGVDVHGGVMLFQERHEQTAEMYDVKHKAACLLKHRLEKGPAWQDFQGRIGKTRCAIQQTEMAFLAPPAPKPKARFMNLQPQLAGCGPVQWRKLAPTTLCLRRFSLTNCDAYTK